MIVYCINETFNWSSSQLYPRIKIIDANHKMKLTSSRTRFYCRPEIVSRSSSLNEVIVSEDGNDPFAKWKLIEPNTFRISSLIINWTRELLSKIIAYWSWKTDQFIWFFFLHVLNSTEDSQIKLRMCRSIHIHRWGTERTRVIYIPRDAGRIQFTDDIRKSHNAVEIVTDACRSLSEIMIWRHSVSWNRYILDMSFENHQNYHTSSQIGNFKNQNLKLISESSSYSIIKMTWYDLYLIRISWNL